MTSPGLEKTLHSSRTEAEFRAMRTKRAILTLQEAAGEEISDDGDAHCSSPRGHEWAYTGTSYGGDDPGFHGEGRCYCIHCGADGDA